MSKIPFADLNTLAGHLRQELETKKFILLYAYNSTGKTRLCTAFKDLGKNGDGDGKSDAVEGKRDTLYFNAFTEDLFSWDNDLDNDTQRVLKINADSKFFAGLEELEMDTRIRRLLDRYADFEFRIDTDTWVVRFSREVPDGEARKTEDDIKISRGEENIFIWCFFLAILQLALDDDGTGPYRWVKYVYIDDPISSLDENNAVAVANHLARLLQETSSDIKTVISTHHVLFFNVLCNEIKKKTSSHFLQKDRKTGGYLLGKATSKPFLQHLAVLADLHEFQESGELSTHHFNMIRRVIEQTACFFGFKKWEHCIQADDDDPDQTLYKRMIDLMSHGDYSIYEPREMMEENKEMFRRILRSFLARYPFNSELFPSEAKESTTP